MKTSTALILAGAGVLILVIYSRSKSTPTSLFGAPSTSTAAVTGLFSGLGSSLGKLFAGGPSSSSSTNTTNSISTAQDVANSPIQQQSDGSFGVSNAEIGNVTGYDSQAGAVGIYGLDYGE